LSNPRPNELERLLGKESPLMNYLKTHPDISSIIVTLKDMTTTNPDVSFSTFHYLPADLPHPAFRGGPHANNFFGKGD